MGGQGLVIQAQEDEQQRTNLGGRLPLNRAQSYVSQVRRSNQLNNWSAAHRDVWLCILDKVCIHVLVCDENAGHFWYKWLGKSRILQQESSVKQWTMTITDMISHCFWAVNLRTTKIAIYCQSCDFPIVKWTLTKGKLCRFESFWSKWNCEQCEIMRVEENRARTENPANSEPLGRRRLCCG